VSTEHSTLKQTEHVRILVLTTDVKQMFIFSFENIPML